MNKRLKFLKQEMSENQKEQKPLVEQNFGSPIFQNMTIIEATFFSKFSYNTINRVKVYNTLIQSLSTSFK